MGVDELIEASRATVTVRLAAGVGALAGLTTTLTGVQLLGFTWRESWRNAVPYVFLLLGVAVFFAADAINRGRAIGAYALPAANGLALLAALGWLVASFPTVMSLMLIVAIFATFGGLILSAVAFSQARRMAQAKAALEDEGLTLGM
ncbi:MAG: hypothetical protein AAF411_25495 [Myxococcota bacterium]